jgi:hypothetical protein
LARVTIALIAIAVTARHDSIEERAAQSWAGVDTVAGGQIPSKHRLDALSGSPTILSCFSRIFIKKLKVRREPAGMCRNTSLKNRGIFLTVPRS